MSITFDDPMNEAAQAAMAELFGEAVAQDERQALFDKLQATSEQVRALEEKAEQPATVAINPTGKIKKMSDGTEYIVTPNGWRKKK